MAGETIELLMLEKNDYLVCTHARSHARTRTHARTHALTHTHARTHALTHALTHARTRTPARMLLHTRPATRTLPRHRLSPYPQRHSEE